LPQLLRLPGRVALCVGGLRQRGVVLVPHLLWGRLQLLPRLEVYYCCVLPAAANAAGIVITSTNARPRKFSQPISLT
jgi:hypothetical protein